MSLKNPTDRLIERFERPIVSMCKRILILAVDLNTFNFNFFKGSINETLLKILSFDFKSPEEATVEIKKIYSDDFSESLTDLDKLAIYLFIRFYKAKMDYDYEKSLLRELSESNNPETIFLYTGKRKLSKMDRERLASGSISLQDLYSGGL